MTDPMDRLAVALFAAGLILGFVWTPWAFLLCAPLVLSLAFIAFILWGAGKFIEGVKLW